jgi:hypothetical protein
VVRRSRKRPKRKISIDDLFDSVFGNGNANNDPLVFLEEFISEEESNDIDLNVDDDEIEVEIPKDVELRKQREQDRLKAKLETFFLDSSPIINPSDSEILDDDTVHRDGFYKRKALDTLKKYRKDNPIITPRKRGKKAVIRSSKSTTIKRCQNCYYSTSSRKLGANWWSTCTNAVKSIEGRPNTFLWVESKLNLSCWKGKDQTEVAA